jgi:hypothetical protein
MTEEPTFTPLSEDELKSLCWIAATSARIAVPSAHLLKLLDAGYIEESVRGPVLTKLGEHVVGRQMPSEGAPPADT